MKIATQGYGLSRKTWEAIHYVSIAINRLFKKKRFSQVYSLELEKTVNSSLIRYLLVFLKKIVLYHRKWSQNLYKHTYGQ